MIESDKEHKRTNAYGHTQQQFSILVLAHVRVCTYAHAPPPSPFRYAGFVTPYNLILIMEFCPGGDLFDQLYRHKSFSVPDTRIFVAQVLLPLEYLHSMSIVHRDLKERAPSPSQRTAFTFSPC